MDRTETNEEYDTEAILLYRIIDHSIRTVLTAQIALHHTTGEVAAYEECDDGGDGGRDADEDGAANSLKDEARRECEGKTGKE